MAIMRIITREDPHVHKKARKVRAVDTPIKLLMEDMLETMVEAHGVGLAAPQVDVPLRVIVMTVEGTTYQLVNPEIVKRSGAQTDFEGCLSGPGYVVELTRANHVVVKGTNRKGKVIHITADGYLARVFQHELDHLEGTLIFDRATTPDAIREVAPE